MWWLNKQVLYSWKLIVNLNNLFSTLQRNDLVPLVEANKRKECKNHRKEYLGKQNFVAYWILSQYSRVVFARMCPHVFHAFPLLFLPIWMGANPCRKIISQPFFVFKIFQHHFKRMMVVSLWIQHNINLFDSAIAMCLLMVLITPNDLCGAGSSGIWHDNVQITFAVRVSFVLVYSYVAWFQLISSFLRLFQQILQVQRPGRTLKLDIWDSRWPGIWKVCHGWRGKKLSPGRSSLTVGSEDTDPNGPRA